jgi:pimeloyl-ACP methyl ester carboxylesterase
MTTATTELVLGDVPLTLDQRGSGQPVLLLHGGGGPQTVSAFAQLLADSGPAGVITPVHPGFGGTPRPDSLATIGGLGDLYARLLDELGLRDVLVVGNSIGGWIAAELALRAPGRIAAVALVDAAGIEVPGHPVADIFPLTPAELARLSFYDPEAFRIDPASMTPEQQRGLAANRTALAVYGGESMLDPGLRARLAGLACPVLVVWGEADQIVDLDYGRAWATAIPGAQFRVLPRAGHLPQLEAPEALAAAIWEFSRAGTAGLT